MRRRLALAAVWLAPAALFVALTWSVYGAYRIPPPERLGPDERAQIVATLRAALDDRDPPPCALRAPGTVVAVTIWSGGKAIARADGEGADLGLATDAAARLVRTAPQIRPLASDVRAAARVQVDVVRGRGAFARNSVVFAALAAPGVADIAAVNPGIDGIAATSGGRTAYVLPHELVAQKLLVKRPQGAASDDLDLATGVDAHRIAALLSGRLGHPVAESELWRVRTDAFVEQPLAHRDQPPLPLTRGNPPPPPLTPQALRDAALAGAHYLVAHLAPSGRFIYEHDLLTGKQTDPEHSAAYSMPRHGGTTYFLAETYRITKAEWLREPIERAIGHLAALLAQGKCGGTLPDGTAFDCVMDRSERTAQLGSTALVVVALVEYQRATGDARYLPLAQRLAAWLLYMQRPDGSFRHVYDPVRKQPDEQAQQLYYSGEAALALARMYVVTNDPRYSTATERALDWLVDFYDFFLGGFYYGEEHWTCIAAEAIWPTVQKPAYDDFCRGYGAFLRDSQPAVGDYPDEDDLAGVYSFSAYVTPTNTPAGSRTEAMISAYLLGVHHGDPDAAIRGQIRAALQYALGQQLRPDNDFAAIGDADGGMPESSVDRTVRIDYVQHTCSAMLRAADVMLQ